MTEQSTVNFDKLLKFFEKFIDKKITLYLRYENKKTITNGIEQVTRKKKYIINEFFINEYNNGFVFEFFKNNQNEPLNIFVPKQAMFLADDGIGWVSDDQNVNVYLQIKTNKKNVIDFNKHRNKNWQLYEFFWGTAIKNTKTNQWTKAYLKGNGQEIDLLEHPAIIHSNGIEFLNKQ